MRYLLAMAVAIGAALAATLFLSSPVATWVTNMYTYDNPDSVSDLHALVFMACNIAALLVGWVVGWALGTPLKRTPKPH